MAFILAEICPGGFDAGEGATVYSGGIGCTELEKHLSCDLTTIEHLWFYSFKDSSAQCNHLINKLWPETFILNVLQHLQVFLLLRWPYNSKAVSICEEVKHESSNPIFLFNKVRCPLLLFKCILKIFLRVDLIAHLVLQLESEVSHDPEE